MVCSSPLHYVRSNNSFSLESRGPFLAGGHDYLPVLRCPTDTCSIRNNIGILSTCGSSSFLQQNDGPRIERFWACGQTPFWLLPWNKGLFGSIYHFRIDTPAGHEAKAKYDLRQSYRILILGPVLHLLGVLNIFRKTYTFLKDWTWQEWSDCKKGWSCPEWSAAK